MKRLQGSVFAVGLLMSVSVLLHAQEARITVPLGWYSLPEFAQALSTPERTVICRSDLSQRVALVHLKERSWEEVRALVQEIGLRLEPSGKGRWRLEWLPSVEMRERRWRTQIAQEQDRQLSEWMRQIREKVPVLPEQHWDEFYRLSKNIEKHVRELAEQDTESGYSGIAYHKQLESLDLGQWAIPPEVMRWVRQVAQLPEELSIPDYGYEPKDLIEYRMRLLLTSVYHVAGYHLAYALARLWAEPSYRLSFLEVYEQGFSVRVVPFAEVLQKVPEVRFLTRFAFGVERAERSEEDLYLFYRLYTYDDGSFPPSLNVAIIDSKSESALNTSPLNFRWAGEPEQEKKHDLWGQVRRFYRPVWQEARSYVEQAQRATETALQHPALQQPFEAEDLTEAPWSRWVYQWAKQTGSEVLMLLNPSQDPTLKAPAKPTLAELYRQCVDFQGYVLAWLALQMREGVLISDVLNNCIIRLRDYPLASLKRLCERWDALEYKDYVEYYRSISPQQNRWWFMGAPFSYRFPFEQAPYEKSLSGLGQYAPGALWFGMYLIEHLPEAQRKELFEKGELTVELKHLPEPTIRGLAELMRSAFPFGSGFYGLWHPRWALESKQSGENGHYEYILSPGLRRVVSIRLERIAEGNTKSRLRIRLAPNPYSVMGNYFDYDPFGTYYR